MKNEFYQVRVTQEIPIIDYDEEGREIAESSGQVETYIAGAFQAEQNARLFAEVLESKIAEGAGYAVSRIRRKVSIIKVIRTEEELEQQRWKQGHRNT